jgi:hypothetical protein
MAYGPPICAACGSQQSVDEHHLIPQVADGHDGPTVWLCRQCHGATHSVEWGNNHQVLTVIGLAKANAVRKAQGKKLGGYRGGPVVNWQRGADANRAQADEFAARLAPVLAELRGKGMTLAQIAHALTEQGIQTARGGRWTPSGVRAIALRLAP